jgi:hypothetical protein
MSRASFFDAGPLRHAQFEGESYWRLGFRQILSRRA